MLAGLLTTAEATTELKCLAELHCCQTALLHEKVFNGQTAPNGPWTQAVQCGAPRTEHVPIIYRICPGQCQWEMAVPH